MGAVNEQTGRAIFYKILDSDGTFRVSSSSDDEQAVKRIVQKKDGSTIAVYERPYTKVIGILSSITVRDIEFKTGMKMKAANIRLRDANPIEPDMIISIPYEGNFFSYFIARVPNIPPNTEIVLKPFSFTKDGRSNRGINIFVEGVKVESFFKVNGAFVNGHPEIKEGEKTTHYWKFFFAESREFMWKFYLDKIAPLFGDDKQGQEPKESASKQQPQSSANNSPAQQQENSWENDPSGEYGDIPYEDLPF